MASTALIDGVNYSWANISFVLFGTIVTGILKISYKRKQKKENNYGWGTEPISRGYGNKEYEGSIEIYQDEWKRIVASSPGRDPFDIPPFDIQVVYGGSRVAPDKDVLRACEFNEDDFTASQGDSKLVVTVPLVIGRIDR